MMQFIILGYVPGTEIRISFQFLATIASIIALVYLSWLLQKEEKLLRTQTSENLKSKTA